MAIKTALSYKQIGDNLKCFHENRYPANQVPFQLLLAIGASTTIVQRYRDSKGTVATYDGLLIKGTLAYQEATTEQLFDTLQTMKCDEKVRKASPALLLVSDGETLLGYDPSADESYENLLSQLYIDYSFFTPLWGISKYRGIEENPADVKAAEKMAKLHDEIRRENEYSNESDLHDLNIFMTRLLFCFFAEDTGIFANNLFTDSLVKYTRPDAADLSQYLDEAFRVMDVERRDAHLNHIFTQFPYVNGGLFSKRIAIPRLGIKARKLMLECGSLDWKSINPDIFGSMIQAVVTPELRSGLGMHYTSVPNIMKLIGPLFLDELKEEVEKLEHRMRETKNLYDVGGITTKELEKQGKEVAKSCNALLARISRMKFFDPACGSGNFLIITYKNLRLLENRILAIIQSAQGMHSFATFSSVISIAQFYGIELDDFACETAILSLWLAEHQMNAKFTEQFGVVINALPLKSISNIHHGNACRVDWNTVCPHTAEEEVFVMGNPPYLGSSLLDKEQQQDRTLTLSKIKNYKKIDYIGIWFYLGALYATDSNVKYAFVSTNSICQGEMVQPLWEPILDLNMKIFFAHTSFKWSNNAKHNAAVICVIVGVTNNKNYFDKSRLYINDKLQKVDNINPYLIAGKNLIIKKHLSSISDFPNIVRGNMPYDGGNLILSEFEKNELVTQYPQTDKYIKRLVGSEDYINDKLRYCLWISDEERAQADLIPEIHNRFIATQKMRLSSVDEGARKMAERPHQFREFNSCDDNTVIIPSTSSIRRNYIPMGVGNNQTVITNSMYFITNAEPILLGILISSMNMLWVKTIGGKLKSDYRYTSLCYNTFPFPTITAVKKKEIEAAANEVLDARDYHCEKTLAELYDPDKMPDDLRQAHHRLDLLVESCYQSALFANDEERLECLFKLYEKMTKAK